ncbi:MAG: sugar ABC transporter ATP-binding protein [Firmicutes bacterium]|nr:sugar ABC transporter ATP-binding protein [Bacillota bacterium]
MSNGSEYAVVMENISKTFPGVKALDRVTFRLKKGEIHALLGENGAGKSTLIKILMGVYQKDRDSGRILLDGQEVQIDSPIKAEQLGLSAVYQHIMLARHLSVAENIFLGQQPKRRGMIDWKKMYEDAEAVLQEFSLQVNPRTLVRDLTPVQQEMVAIAKALARRAKVLVLDEPTAQLAEEETDQLHRTMRELKKAGISIIYISHRLDEIFKVCDVATVLRDGQYIGTKPVSELTEGEIIRMMVGRSIDDLYYKEEIKIGREILRVKNLTRHPVVKNASFSLHEGEVLGVFGLVGSGRTELVRCIFGADTPDSGEIEIEGRPVKIQSPTAAIENKVALIPEDRQQQGLALPLTLGDNCNLISGRQVSRYGFRNLRHERDTARRNVEDLRIRTPGINQKVKFLSGGNQQKVVISKWLNVDSKVLIFDEPTVGIDVGAKTEIYRIMADLLKQGKGIIFISSYLPELLGICDRIMVIAEGEVTGILRREEATQEKLLALASNL